MWLLRQANRGEIIASALIELCLGGSDGAPFPDAKAAAENLSGATSLGGSVVERYLGTAFSPGKKSTKR